MKITDIRIRRLRKPLDPPFKAAWDPVPRRHFDATLVYVDTDEGITGIGSGDTMEGFEPFKELFIGKDPLRIAQHVKRIETINFHAGRYWPLEAALWDIIGQVYGQPVSRLFGNATDRVPAYASCGEDKSPEARVEMARAAYEDGFRAMKIRIDRNRPEEGLQAIRQVRGALGDRMEIMVDLNQAWRSPGDISQPVDLVGVQRLAAQLRELDVFWLEEPIPAEDIQGVVNLRAAGGLRIAAGEMMRTLPEMLAYVDADALDVYQPDVVLAVGMHRARLVGELVMARNRHFTPHTWSNGIGVLANLHVTAGVGGGPYLEFPYDPPGWTVERRDFMLAEKVNVDEEGYFVVPDRPGLGVVLDDAAVEQYTVD